MKSHTALPHSPEQHILFIHGIFNTGRIFALMVKDAKQHGFVPHAPSLKRADGRATMRELAEQVQEYVREQIPSDAVLHLVGFSMGGVVARCYAQMFGGANRITSLLTIASPHTGSLWAYLHPLRGARDLRPGSEILRALQESEAVLTRLPVAAFHTPLDTMIVPFTSAIWQRAANTRFWWQFHPFMAFSPRIRAALWEFVGSVRV